MPRKLLRRYLPTHDRLRGRREIQCFGKLLDDPFLLHLNRRSVAGGVALGVFVAFIPLPFQMLIAAGLAIWFRVNILISVASVWVSNPITLPPLLYFCYQLGKFLLGEPTRAAAFTPSLEWFWAELGAIWQPLLLGSLVAGAVASLTAFIAVHLLWRLLIVRELRLRKRRPKNR